MGDDHKHLTSEAYDEYDAAWDEFRALIDALPRPVPITQYRDVSEALS